MQIEVGYTYQTRDLNYAVKIVRYDEERKMYIGKVILDIQKGPISGEIRYYSYNKEGKCLSSKGHLDLAGPYVAHIPSDVPVTAKKDHVIDGKINYIYLHPSVKYQVGLAMMAGAQKYGEWNYLKGHKASDLYASTHRHLDEWFYGRVEFDKDCSERVGASVHHLANAIAGLQMLLAQVIEGTVIDDRPATSLKVLDTKGKNNKHWESTELNRHMQKTQQTGGDQC